jgi:hypothetical protein
MYKNGMKRKKAFYGTPKLIDYWNIVKNQKAFLKWWSI